MMEWNFVSKTKKAWSKISSWQRLSLVLFHSRNIYDDQLYHCASLRGYLVSTGDILVGDGHCLPSLYGVDYVADVYDWRYYHGAISVVKWRRSVLTKCWSMMIKLSAVEQKRLRQIESIEFKDFNFTYPGEEAPLLKDINLTLNKRRDTWNRWKDRFWEDDAIDAIITSISIPRRAAAH